jgi:hypothetical protein
MWELVLVSIANQRLQKASLFVGLLLIHTFQTLPEIHMSSACCSYLPASSDAFVAGSVASVRVGSSSLGRTVLAPLSASLMRLWHATRSRLLMAWADWQAVQAMHARRQAVAHLDARMRKDVGMGEFAYETPAPHWADLERARW